jgi:hypothetical protein
MTYWEVKVRLYYKGGNQPKYTEHRILVASEIDTDFGVDAARQATNEATKYSDKSRLLLGAQVIEAGTRTLPLKLK